MDQPLTTTVSPHRSFTRSQWAALRADTPLTLTADEVAALRSLNDPVSLDDVVDGFLLPNAVLLREGLMERKGFPESYDLPALLAFLNDIKAGKHNVAAPVYSHLVYDIVPGEKVLVERPDILIVEGLNVLQTSRLPRAARAVPFVSDFFDFSIYLDADESVIRRWYIERFLRLRETAFRNPASYFHRYAALPEGEAIAVAEGLWNRINLVNLRENILPTRPRADLILRKSASHAVEEVALRRI